MELASSIFLALGLAADACAISLSGGLTIRHIKIYKAIKIALFFGTFQAIMPLIGWLSGLSIRGFLAQFDSWIVFIILSYLGGKMIYESFAEDDNNKKTKFNILDTYTLIALSVATSIDALAAGLGLSIFKNSILMIAATIGFITFILSFIGVYIGHFCGDLFKSKIEIIGGATLIFLGIKTLF